MSREDGYAALALEAPKRVPRTEYSAERHWELVREVTGIDIDQSSTRSDQERAARAFMGPEGWDYSIKWHNLIDEKDLGKVRTDMGHAVYEADGSDFSSGGYSYFTDYQQVLDFIPEEHLERHSHSKLITLFEEDYRREAASYTNGVAMTGTYITLISGCIALYGWDLFLTALGLDAEAAGRMLGRYASWIEQYTLALADSDVPVVLLHDDMVWSSGPFVSPLWYRTYVFPLLKRLIDPLKEAGKKVLFACDGDYTCFIDDIAACGPDGFIFEPFTDLAYLAENYGKTHVLIGNVDTRILLTGTKEDIYQETRRCMDTAKGCPGYFMAVGNHIPANTPVESALYYQECYSRLSLR